jgi:FtsZ-binding cell division protein ZapB
VREELDDTVADLKEADDALDFADTMIDDALDKIVVLQNENQLLKQANEKLHVFLGEAIDNRDAWLAEAERWRSIVCN